LDLSSAEDIEGTIQIFISKIRIATANASPKTSQHSSQHQRGLLPPNAAALLSLKRRVRKEYARIADTPVNSIYKRLANRLQKVPAS